MFEVGRILSLRIYLYFFSFQVCSPKLYWNTIKLHSPPIHIQMLLWGEQDAQQNCSPSILKDGEIERETITKEPLI